jgi:hypothetical protein
VLHGGLRQASDPEANGCFDWVIAAAANPGLDGIVGMMMD